MKLLLPVMNQLDILKLTNDSNNPAGKNRLLIRLKLIKLNRKINCHEAELQTYTKG